MVLLNVRGKLPSLKENTEESRLSHGLCPWSYKLTTCVSHQEIIRGYYTICEWTHVPILLIYFICPRDGSISYRRSPSLTGYRSFGVYLLCQVSTLIVILPSIVP